MFRCRRFAALALLALAPPSAAAAGRPATLADLCGRTLAGTVVVDPGRTMPLIDGDCIVTLADGASLTAREGRWRIRGRLIFDLGRDGGVRLEGVWLVAHGLTVTGDGVLVVRDGLLRLLAWPEIGDGVLWSVGGLVEVQPERGRW